ncbi:uncharacterized protein [Aquarana catesbeiana]|uniref:uncharacterized protein n=1 Tax=Aquarana catesbeiana TaxID=8400 RepID=UPI003CC954AD
MWISPLVLLFLALVLIPDPGVSQIGPQVARCRDCQTSKELTEEIKKKVKSFSRCPHRDTIRLELENGRIFCAKKDQPLVKELIDCLERKASNCQEDTSQKDFSKGTNEKPSTTTTNAPTTAPVTSMKSSTQSRDQNIGQSTEPAEPAAPRNLNSTPLEYNKANGNLAQGKDKSIETQDAGDPHSKIKHMQTTIISLIAIVLVLVAVGVGLYCRMKKTNAFGTPCGSRNMKYTDARSEDPFIEVNVEQ